MTPTIEQLAQKVRDYREAIRFARNTGAKSAWNLAYRIGNEIDAMVQQIPPPPAAEQKNLFNP